MASTMTFNIENDTHPLLQPLYIGGLEIKNRLMVAPMAGVTDNPFRRLCKSFGAGHAVSEMMTADATLYAHKKSLFRANFEGEIAPISAQIAGADVDKIAEAARYQVNNGAQIIDIIKFNHADLSGNTIIRHNLTVFGDGNFAHILA